MSNFSNARKLNAVYKDSLAVINTNSNLDYYDEVNIGSSYRNTVDVSDIKIDTIPASPDFINIFDAQMDQDDFTRFGIDIDPDDLAQKKYVNAYLDDTQTVIRFVRAELTPVGNSVDSNGGSFYCLDHSGKNLLEDMIPYTAANSLGQLDDAYENTKLEYSPDDGISYINIILLTNYHGNAILNHRQGLVTFNSNPSWSLKNGVSVPINQAQNSNGDSIKIYLTFYKYVGKKGIRVLNSTDVSGGLVVGGEYSLTDYKNAPNDGAIIQGNVGIGNWSPTSKLHISSVGGEYTNVRTAATPGNAVSYLSSISSIKLSPEASLHSDYLSIGLISGNGAGNNPSSFFQMSWDNNANYNYDTINTIGANILLNPVGGKVGIATTEPSQKLDVSGNIITNGNIYINTNEQDPHGHFIKMHSGYGNDGGLFLYRGHKDTADGTDNFKFILEGQGNGSIVKDDNVSMTFKDGGGNVGINVGINETNPQYKLDVNGNVRIKSAPLTLDTVDGNNEGGELRFGSYTEGTHNGYWTFDSYKDKLRIFGTSNLQVAGGSALRIYSDTTEGLYKVGINRSWNYSQTEALDVSGNIRIDNGNNNINTQGGQLIFDNGYNKDGPNKIVLSHNSNNNNSYGFGVDDSTLKYISGSNTHKWYHGGQINQNGTLGMTLNQTNLSVVGNITGGGDLTLPTHKLSTNTYTVYQSDDTPKLTFKGIDTTSTPTLTGGNLDININNSGDLTQIKLSSGGASFIHSYLNVGSSSANTNYMLNVEGTLHATSTISTGANITATGTITQSSTSTNTFNGHTYFGDSTGGDGRVRVYNTLYSTKVVAGNPGMTAANDYDLLISGSTGSHKGKMRINHFGLLEFTQHYNTGHDSKFGTTVRTSPNDSKVAADWKIEHNKESQPAPEFGDNLAFSFKKTYDGNVRENTVLRLCPSSYYNEPRTNNSGAPVNFETDLTYNAIFNGDVKINGNLVVDLNTSSRDTVVETAVYQNGLAIPFGQMLRLSDNSGVSKIRFDLKSDSSPQPSIDGFGDTAVGRIILYNSVKLSIPETSVLGYHVPSTGSHRFYTNGHTSEPQLTLRIDNTNNVVIGSENSGNTSTLDYYNETSDGANGRTPSLLNLWNSETNVPSSETMIQFSNGNTTHPYRIGINSGSDNENKFSVVTNDNTDIFTIDTEYKKLGINNNDPNSATHGKILDISGGIAVNYDDKDHFSYIGKLQIGQVKNDTSVGFSHIHLIDGTTGNDLNSYGVAHADNGTLHLNGITGTGSGICFSIANTYRMQLSADAGGNFFKIGGLPTSAPVNVNIVHAGTTQHTGNMTIEGDLSFNLTTTSNNYHKITMDNSNHIKLDNVTIDGHKLTLTPSGNTQSGFYSQFYEDTTGHTTIRGGLVTSRIIIGDVNGSGKIYLGESTSTSLSTDYRILSSSLTISKNSSDDSIHATGNVNIDGNLIMNDPTKQININSGKLTIANATGDVVSQGNLSLNNVNSTDNYFKIYDDNANNEKFSVQYSTGNTIIKGTLNLTLDQPTDRAFAIGGSIATSGTMDDPEFEILNNGTTTINNKLIINSITDPNGIGIQLDSGDLVIKNQNFQIRESNNTTVSFEVDHDGNINHGTWKANIISTKYGGLGADVSEPTTGQILIAQTDGTYLPGNIVSNNNTITIDGNTVGVINIESNVQSVSIGDFGTATNGASGLMSADDKRAMEIIREFMFANNSLNENSDADNLHEGLVRKVKTYRTKTYYQFESGTMSKLFVGSFLYDLHKPTASASYNSYNDYDMVGESFYLDVQSGNYTIPDDTNLLSSNFSQEPIDSNSNSVYRVLFWQDYVTTSSYGSIDIEFQCPYHEVDFSISNYKYNTVLYVNDDKFNPLSESRFYHDMKDGNSGKILAEGRSQVINDKGPRGQMFPLNGHFDYVTADRRVRIMVLVNTSQSETDSNARLNIDARSAYLKVTELNDTNAT